MRREKNSAAVDAAGKTDADGLQSRAGVTPARASLRRARYACGLTDLGRDDRGSRRDACSTLQPLRDFIRQRADVTATDVVEVSWKGVSLWREEACVGRIGVRAADELEFDDV